MSKPLLTNLFRIYFDGGWNGTLYGSWEVQYNGMSKKVNRETYDSDTNPGTCNVAEYESLISALKWLQSVKDKHQYRVEIWGDSALVVNQVRIGGWKTKKPHLKPRRDRVRWLLSGFGDWEIFWHRRNHSVSRFGH